MGTRSLLAFVLVGMLGTSAQAALGEPLESQLKQDFFAWFGWTEQSRTPQGALTEIKYGQRPESMFKEWVDLRLTIDDKGVLVGAELWVQGAFLTGKYRPMAEDLVKSFGRFVGDADLKTDKVERDGASWGKLTATPKAAAPVRDARWLGLFLGADDLPGLRMTQDARAADDMAVWMSPKTDAAVWRVVDIRWEFPDEAAAQRFLETSKDIHEGMPVVASKPITPGAKVYGGSMRDPILDLPMTQYIVAFRKGRVVAKLFVAQGPEAADGSLTLAQAEALGRAILKRI